MSCNESHFGKLRKVDLQGKSKEEWAKEKYEHFFPNKPLPHFYTNDYVEALIDNVPTFVCLNNEFYELFDYKSCDEYHNDMSVNPDGTLSFSCLFHNGATCLNEMLEESLKNLKK